MLCVVVSLLRVATALDNGLGLTPPMGWSSWNVYAGDIDEAKIMATIDAMAALKPFGYEYVNIDDNWEEPTRGADGNLQARKDKFPHGIKFLADHAHSQGLKLGIYSAHGSRTCQGNAGSGPDHWTQDAELFASWGVDYLKLDSCGGYPSNYTSVAEQYREYAAMRDALNRTGRPIYYSICAIATVQQTPTVLNSPSSCGKTSGYTSLPWLQQGYDVKGLANSVLVEWVNNNNNFCKRGAPPTAQLTLQPCRNSTAQTFTLELDGSIRHGGSASMCLDVYNCEKADGTAVGLYPCHPGGKTECGYANQQFKVVDGAIVNANSGTCLTAIGPVDHQRIVISACVAGSRAQEFEAAAAGEAGAVKAADGRCLAYTSEAPHCCESGWVSQIDSQQDLTLDSLSHPGYWNDNDMLSVGCNAPGVNGSAHTPCAGYQSLLEQRSQFALWCVLASPLILGHDVTTMGPEVRSIITNTEMIALNQDALGHRAAIAYQSDPYNRTLTIFVKRLSNSSSPRAAALFNRGDTVAQLSLTRTQMAFDAGKCACVNLRDVDSHETVVSGVHGEVLFTQELQPHEVRVLRASCC